MIDAFTLNVVAAASSVGRGMFSVPGGYGEAWLGFEKELTF